MGKAKTGNGGAISSAVMARGNAAYRQARQARTCKDSRPLGERKRELTSIAHDINVHLAEGRSVRFIRRHGGPLNTLLAAMDSLLGENPPMNARILRNTRENG